MDRLRVVGHQPPMASLTDAVRVSTFSDLAMGLWGGLGFRGLRLKGLGFRVWGLGLGV